MPQLKHPGYTVEEWATWEGHWELINGVAYAMAPPTLEHQRVSRQLSQAIGMVLDETRRKSGNGDCEVFYAPCGLFLAGSETALEPDLMVVCDPGKKSVRGIEGPPDLVVEILSPSTAQKDLTRKRWTYEAAGVPEYLIVDSEDHWGLLLRLENGRYQEACRIEWGGLLPLLGGRLPITLGPGGDPPGL
jgi:Uma2 family endonuclease